jgi:hypothetical protein
MMDMPVLAKFSMALLVLSNTGSGSMAGPALKMIMSRVKAISFHTVMPTIIILYETPYTRKDGKCCNLYADQM